MEHLAWYTSRGTGIVTWGLLLANVLWGLLYATRKLRERVPSWWMLGVHQFLGALAVVFVAVHVLAIVADGYTTFGPTDVLVPLASAWRPWPVALGIVATYLLAAVEVTSLLRRHLSRTTWRSVHLTSYGVLALSTLHALTAGTDARASLGGGVAVAIGMVTVVSAVSVWILRSTAPDRGASGRVTSSVGDPAR
jgi:predicted ferric reductase